MRTKILLVDDSADFCTTLSYQLELQGYEVIAAYSGKIGIDKAEKEKPDLVLLDIMMPDMNGSEVALRLRSSPLTASIPIILITSLLDKSDISNKTEAGKDPVLPKSAEIKDYVAKIKETLIQKK